MRFRIYKVAIDVEQMFHQVRVKSEDMDALRFLWKEDILCDGPPDEYRMNVHIFGTIDSTFCANYALKRTGRDNYQDFDAITYESVIKSFYVYD